MSAFPMQQEKESIPSPSTRRDTQPASLRSDLRLHLPSSQQISVCSRDNSILIEGTRFYYQSKIQKEIEADPVLSCCVPMLCSLCRSLRIA